MTIDDRPLTIAGAPSSIVHRPSSIVDTHCHLDLAQFDADREAVIDRAVAAGVGRIVNPAIDLDSCGRVVALAERHEPIYAAVGVHPNDCAEFDDAAVDALRALAGQPKVVAIGEIGLDYYWDKVPHAQQIRALRTQLALAAELGLPIILHSRDASADDRQCSEDLLTEIGRIEPAARKRDKDGILGIWHAFSGDLDDAQRAYELGLILGLGGPVTFLNARRLHALVPGLRLDRLVLETDAPYLAPHPYRGRRNEPAYVPLIAEALAALFSTSVEAVAATTTATASACFGLVAGATAHADERQPTADN
jgi:TatD DNase family protein